MNPLINKIVQLLLDKKALDISAYDVKASSTYTDTIIVCSCENKIHTKTLANDILRLAKKEEILVYSKEGLENRSWILIDFIDIVVHIFTKQTREYYNIEEIWNDAKKIPIGESLNDKTSYQS